MAEKNKIRTITIDTLTGIQSETYMRESKKPNFDKWTDYGKDIWNLISTLQNLGFEIVMILGEPGTGKSSGMRTLPKGTNIWYNADNKNPVWKGGKEEYGKKNNPKSPYHVIPKSYNDIIKHIKQGVEGGNFEEERVAILTGHTEDYKTGDSFTKRRLKTLGNLATKMQLEGKLETVLYSNVEREGGKSNYILETENNGFNTARSPMDLFEPVIDNDYNYVIEKILEY